MFASSDKTVSVKLTAIVSDYKAKMGEASASTKKFANEAKDSVGGAKTEVGAIGKAAAGASLGLKAMAVGAGALAGTALVGFLSESTQAASDLQQTVMKSKVIFGDSAGQIDKWGSTAAENLGLSKSAAIGAAASFGDMFSQLGFAKDAATGMSTKVVQLAADLGSFNNVDTATVLDMISGAFRGEYDSLQRLIPNISAARVETEAMAETGKASAKELTAQEKASATLAIVMKDGARAQGDFARSAGTLAIEQQKANAKLEDAKAKLGDALLPVMTKATEAMSAGVDAAVAIGSALSKIPGPVTAAVAALTAFHMLKGPIGAMGGKVTGVVKDLALALDFAAQSSARAGGGLKGAAAGLKTFTGGIGAGAMAANGLKSAGSALLGLVGGPLGLAFTGATVAVTAFYQAQQNAKQASDELAATFDKVTGKATELSRTKVRDSLMGDLSSSDQKLLSDLGVSFTEGADAALKGGQALADYKNKILDLRSGHLEAFAAAEGYVSSLQNQSEVSHDAALNAGVLAKETKGAGTAAQDAAPKVEPYKAVVDDLKTASENAAKKQKDLSDAMLGVIDAAVGADTAAINYQAAIDAATQSVKDNGKTLDINTEAGRSNKQALIDLAEKARDSAKANLENGDSASSVSEKMVGKSGNGGMRKAFIDAAEKMGLSKTKAQELATQYGLTKTDVDNLKTSMDNVPKQVVSKLKVDADNAIREVAALRRALALLKDKTIDITTRYKTSYDTSYQAAKNRSAIEDVRRAGGGPVFGAGTATSDSIPAWLSNGEHVWTAAEVAAVGGHAALERMRKAALAGSVPRFASGGAVGPVRTMSMGATLDPDAVGRAVARYLPPQMSVYSGADAKSAAESVLRRYEWRTV